jgi:hypothetical protein
MKSRLDANDRDGAPDNLRTLDSCPGIWELQRVLATDFGRMTGHPELIWETDLNFRVADDPGAIAWGLD